MIRKAAAKGQIKNGFRLRGHEVKRIEAFSDAVFAFAVTLLIVSLEVPQSFDELLTALQGFLPFGVSFTFLMLIWHEQNVFFRRYAMDDPLVVALNCALIFIVLFFVYPLKFLFTLIFSTTHHAMQIEQVPLLMTIYGAGFSIIYFIFFLMYTVALKRSEALELNAAEKFDTRTKIFVHLIFICISACSVILAWTLPAGQAGMAGLFYCVIGPALTIFFGYRSKRKRLLQL